MNLKNIMQKLSPRYKNLIIAAFFIGISLFVLFPFLFQENFMVSSDSDAMYYYYPAFNFYSNALKNGESFLWNPLLFSGFPTYLSQSGGFLDPLNILIFKFLPAIFGYNFRLLIDFILVMVFSYLAARSFGISKLASSLVGMGYLTAFHWRFLTNILIANSLFLLPFLFFIFNKALEDKKNKWFWAVLGGTGIGWVFLSGYAQFIVYSVFLLGLYGVIYIFWIERDKKNLYKWLTLVSIFVILILVGFIVGAPQIVSSSKFTPLTQRADGLDYSLTTYKVVDPGDMILFLFPTFQAGGSLYILAHFYFSYP